MPGPVESVHNLRRGAAPYAFSEQFFPALAWAQSLAKPERRPTGQGIREVVDQGKFGGVVLNEPPAVRGLVEKENSSRPQHRPNQGKHRLAFCGKKVLEYR
jgi:hypothetical protein